MKTRRKRVVLRIVLLLLSFCCAKCFFMVCQQKSQDDSYNGTIEAQPGFFFPSAIQIKLYCCGCYLDIFDHIVQKSLWQCSQFEGNSKINSRREITFHNDQMFPSLVNYYSVELCNFPDLHKVEIPSLWNDKKSRKKSRKYFFQEPLL